MGKITLLTALICFIVLGALNVSAIECSDAELTGDGIVNAFDLLKVSQCYNRGTSELSTQNESCSPIDMNGDNFINDFEKLLVTYYYRTSCEENTNKFECSDADFNSDNVVNGFDLLMVRQCLDDASEECSDLDLNNDRQINDFEKGMVDNFYLEGCGEERVCEDWDINGNGRVDEQDWQIVRERWGEGGCSLSNNWCDWHDINKDGEINTADWREIYSNVGKVCVSAKYLLLKDFGNIEYQQDSYEIGSNADGVDAFANFFSSYGFIDGESAKYEAPSTDYNGGIFVVVSEFKNKIPYSAINEIYLQPTISSGGEIDCDPAGAWGKTGDAQIHFQEKGYYPIQFLKNFIGSPCESNVAQGIRKKVI